MIGISYYGNEHKIGNIYVTLVKLDNNASFIRKINKFIKAGDLEGAFKCATSSKVGNKIAIKPIASYDCKSGLENNKLIGEKYIDLLNSVHMFWNEQVGLKEILRDTPKYLSIISELSSPLLSDKLLNLKTKDNIAMQMAELICKQQFDDDMVIHESIYGNLGKGLAGDKQTEKYIKENPNSPFVKRSEL